MKPEPCVLVTVMFKETAAAAEGMPHCVGRPGTVPEI
jgi:hypothetical protein